MQTHAVGSLCYPNRVTTKRLGDGFYEQKLVREQVLVLTGQRFLGNYASNDAQYKALMDSGLTHARAMNLRPGIALTAEQVAQLSSVGEMPRITFPVLIARCFHALACKENFAAQGTNLVDFPYKSNT